MTTDELRELLAELYGHAKGASDAGERVFCGCGKCQDLEQRVKDIVYQRSGAFVQVYKRNYGPRPKEWVEVTIPEFKGPLMSTEDSDDGTMTYKLRYEFTGKNVEVKIPRELLEDAKRRHGTDSVTEMMLKELENSLKSISESIHDNFLASLKK